MYFVSSTVNPILYNLLSRKFRYAFKRTFCRCCIDLDKFPTFYKLKAIFRSKNDPVTVSPSGTRILYQQKPKQIRINNFGNNDGTSSQQRLLPNNNVSTKDSLLKVSNSSSSNSGSHAHSDGRLHFLCRHKSCSSNRTRPSFEGQLFCKHQNNTASCQDIDTLRKMSQVNRTPLVTFNSVGADQNIGLNNFFY